MEKTSQIRRPDGSLSLKFIPSKLGRTLVVRDGFRTRRFDLPDRVEVVQHVNRYAFDEKVYVSHYFIKIGSQMYDLDGFRPIRGPGAWARWLFDKWSAFVVLFTGGRIIRSVDRRPRPNWRRYSQKFSTNEVEIPAHWVTEEITLPGKLPPTPPVDELAQTEVCASPLPVPSYDIDMDKSSPSMLRRTDELDALIVPLAGNIARVVMPTEKRPTLTS